MNVQLTFSFPNVIDCQQPEGRNHGLFFCVSSRPPRMILLVAFLSVGPSVCGATNRITPHHRFVSHLLQFFYEGQRGACQVLLETDFSQKCWNSFNWPSPV